MPTKKKKRRNPRMKTDSKSVDRDRKYIAAPVEKELYEAFVALAGKLQLNTKQLLRRAVVEVLRQNSEAIPETTQRELAKDTQYKRGRPRKDGSVASGEGAPAPARPIPGGAPDAPKPGA